MQQTLRPYVTTGVAIVGVAVIAVVPAAPQLLDGHQAAHSQQHAVRLVAGPGDPFTPYVDLITNTLSNLQALGSHAFEFPILSQFLSDPSGSIAHIPDALNLLSNLTPTIDVGTPGLPLDLTIDLPMWLTRTLAQLGPLMTLTNAAQSIGTQISDGNAFAAILGAPATLLNGLLNGTDGIDILGTNVPLFNGLLVSGQPFDLNMNVGDLVNAVGFGDKTIADLLGDFGNQSMQTLFTDLLNSLGVGGLTPVGLLDQMGVGQESVVNLLMSLVDSTGMGDESVAALLDQFGYGGDTTVASLLIGLLDSSDIGNPTITELLGQFGLGDATLGSLIKDMLDPTGMGSATLPSLLDPTMTLGGLLTGMVGDQTFTDMLTGLGVGDMTLPEAIAMMMGDYGTQTLVELLGQGFLGPVDPSAPLIDVFQAMLPPGYDFNDLLTAGDNPVGLMTIGELVQLGANPYGPGTMADMKFTDLLTMVGIGDQTLMDLAGGPTNPDASNINKIGNPTLNNLLGTNTVEQTLQNLRLWDVNINELVAALGPAGQPGMTNYPISDLLTALTLGPNYQEVSLADFLTSIGFNPDLNTLLAGFVDGLGLGDATLVQLLSLWGLNNVSMSSIIDQLGLNNLNLVSMLNALGLNNLDLDTIIDRLGLSNIYLTSLLDNLGLNTVHLDTVINSVFGNLTMGSILDNLGLDNVTLDAMLSSLLGGLLGDTTLSSVLTSLGMDTNTLDSIVSELLTGLGLSDATINTLLGDLGIDNTDMNSILDGLGLSGIDALSVQTGDFFGPIADALINLPQQIAAALAGG